ncbi:hypothetical protein GGI15_000563 [Coemansia interrupta]|uniref:Uncharacterized protein n=1 Tax=Coemansia interrupta TaxID=1126814 RepID=A0A9W8LPP7_9FUNG|nr:hypothetical protein GGI15_000563 [Coemansia interrupta]
MRSSTASIRAEDTAATTPVTASSAGSSDVFFDFEDSDDDDDDDGDKEEKAEDVPTFDEVDSGWATQIDEVAASDPLQVGVAVAHQAVRLFLNSDFEAIDRLLEPRRATLLYASEGHAAIQYLRAMMSFTKEAMRSAQTAADATVALAVKCRKSAGSSGGRTPERSAWRRKGTEAGSDRASVASGVSADGEAGRRQAGWGGGLTGVAGSLLGMVGLGRPAWHALRSMTAAQRHADLVHAEAHLLSAMLGMASGDGVIALVRDGWHVKSSYAAYRACNMFVQDVHQQGGRLDDHYVSGAYFGVGVFNLVLSMLPARLLRLVEVVGFSGDRALGLEMLAVAAGWRSHPVFRSLMHPAPAGTECLHPCGQGLRSEFCMLVLVAYHVFLCSSMCLGYPNVPLAEAVLAEANAANPHGLMFMYFSGLLHMTRRQVDEAVGVFGRLVGLGKHASKRLRAAGAGTVQLSSTSSILDSELLRALRDLRLEDCKKPSDPTKLNEGRRSEWRQLQYMGYWERALCYMSLGMWMLAAEGFNKLRLENNWNKAVYTYSLACCLWEQAEMMGGDSDEQRSLREIVATLMAAVPALQRKVAGKSIPLEKFVMRKARRFDEQGGFLMRPGLELVASWNLYAKTPADRLHALLAEVNRDIGQLAAHTPETYRHTRLYDDLSVLLLVKAHVLHELSRPTCVYNLQPPSADIRVPAAVAADCHPELAVAAADSYLRVLRLLPLVARDHYLAACARYHLGALYLAGSSIDGERVGWARAHWKCILAGRPITAAPFVSRDEWDAHRKVVGVGNKAAQGCEVEEGVVAASGHMSLRFFDGGHCPDEWRYCPPMWADSKKYSLQNAIEMRTFNSDNRLAEAQAAAAAVAQ